MNEPDERPAAALRRLIDGYQVTQAIHVAVTLGIADLLAGGPRGVEDLAEASRSHAPSLYRLLRALASVGIFHEEDHRRFSLTPFGGHLRADAPESLAGWAGLVGRPYYWQAWSELLHGIRTGENAFRHTHGVGVWEYRAHHPEEGAIFDRAMTSTSRQTDRAVVEAFDFGRFRTVVDVGGGHGAFLAAVLVAHPEMTGVLFDQPHVVARAGGLLEAAGVSDRCRIVGGSFFEQVPEGGDAYLLKEIIHDWEDEEAVALLRVCRRVVPPAGRVLLVERDLGGPNADPGPKFADLNMLVSPGGRERTVEEYAALFQAAGFRLSGTTTTPSVMQVLEGAPAG